MVIDNQPGLYPQLYFNGLTVYWAAYLSVTRKSSPSGKRSWGDPNKESERSLKYKYKNHCVLLEPHYWPKDKKGEQIKLTSGAI